MILIKLVWILAMSSLVASKLTFSEVRLDLVLSLARHFMVDYCVLGKTDGPTDLDLFLGRSYPSRKNLFTNFLTFQQISELLFGNSNLLQRGKTMIILNLENSTLTYLKEISRSTSLSAAIWVLFSESSYHAQLFRDIYIPFDCEFIHVSQSALIFSLTEVYQIGKNTKAETYDFGHWTEENGLVIGGVHFYSRRNNLKGHRVTAVIKNNPPYVSIEKDSKGNSKFKGYLYEIWSELEFRLNFRTEFPEIYFDKDPNDILKSEEVDFAVARISVVPSTFDNMDFSQPVHEAKSHMFSHRPGSELDWDSYLKPFSRNTWFVSILWLFSSSWALAFLYRKAWDFGTSEREADYFTFTFSESLLTVFRAICMQGSDVTPRSNSCRLFFLSIYLTALVVTSAFSAALFSLLTIPKPRSPFNSLEEVFNNNKFQIGFPSDPDFLKLIEDFSAVLASSNQKKLLERLAKSRDLLNPPRTPQEDIQHICEDKFYVFVFDLPNVLYLMQNISKSCHDKILPFGPPLLTEFIGFGFKKKNPYKELINFHLIRMKNEGILNRLLLNYWPPQIPTVQATWVRVTLSDISPILYMFALGAILGVMILQFEKVLLHIKGKKKINASLDPSTAKKQLDSQIFLSGFSTARSSDWGLYYKINYKK